MIIRSLEAVEREIKAKDSREERMLIQRERRNENDDSERRRKDANIELIIWLKIYIRRYLW